jgi:hypothetical protein
MAPTLEGSVHLKKEELNQIALIFGILYVRFGDRDLSKDWPI